VPPSGGLLKLNWDAALNASLRTMGMGAVLRDGTGKVIAALAQVVPQVHDSSTTEAVALWRAIQMCNGQSFGRVMFEGDCLTVVNVVCQDFSCWN
jgi:hypothetical protein